LLHVHKSSVTRAKQLAERALLTGERLVYLLAKTVLAHIVANEGFAETNQSLSLSHATKRVLEGVLREVSQIEPHTPLHIEIEVRAHLSLSEACAVLTDDEGVLNHASEVVYLAPKVGLASIGWMALYQIADVHFRQGKMDNTRELLSEVLEVTPLDSPLHSWALSFQAITHFWLGNEDTALTLYETLEGDIKNECQWLPVLTLQYPKRTASGKNENGLASAFVHLFESIRNSREIDLTNTIDTETNYILAAQSISKLAHVFGKGWYSTFGNVAQAIVLTRVGRFHDAALRFPTVPELEQLPPAAKALSYAALIELGIKLRELGIDQTLNGLNGLNKTLQEMPLATLHQVAKKLALMTPLGFATASQWGEVPIPVLQTGSELIMSFRQRRTVVFGKEGIEPSFAADLTLFAFGCGDIAPLEGGRQTKAIRGVLVRSYHQAEYWYQPVSPAEIICSFLILESHVSEKARRIASEVFRRFKIVPRLRESDTNEALDQLEEVLLDGLGVGLDVTRLKHFFQKYGA
jgi:tetratricopeptide (TPR) repeat protein